MRKTFVTLGLIGTFIAPSFAFAAKSAPVPRAEWIKRPAAIKDLRTKLKLPAKTFSVQRNYDNGGFNWINIQTKQAGTISRVGIVRVTGKLVPANQLK